MATLKKRRKKWYARVQWNANNLKKEKQIPLRTTSKMTARMRLAEVNKVEADIKCGVDFIFPWINEVSTTSVIQFSL